MNSLEKHEICDESTGVLEKEMSMLGRSIGYGRSRDSCYDWRGKEEARSFGNLGATLRNLCLPQRTMGVTEGLKKGMC